MKWIVAGSSRGGPSHFRAVRELHRDAKVITTNAAIEFVTDICVPDVYFLTDGVAQKRFDKWSRYVQFHGGTMATLNRKQTALRDRGVLHYDEFIDTVGPGATYMFRRDTWSRVALSGLYCVQYALLKGNASELHIVGHEGYRGGDKDYFNGLEGPPRGCRHTENMIEPFYADAVKAYPEVEFHLYGSIHWRMPDADNITKHSGRSIHVC